MSDPETVNERVDMRLRDPILRFEAFGKYSRGGLLLELVKNGLFSLAIRRVGGFFRPKTVQTACSMRADFNRPGVFLGVLAYFLAFGYQYFISPPRDRPRPDFFTRPLACPLKSDKRIVCCGIRLWAHLH